MLARKKVQVYLELPSMVATWECPSCGHHNCHDGKTLSQPMDTQAKQFPTIWFCQKCEGDFDLDTED